MFDNYEGNEDAHLDSYMEDRLSGYYGPDMGDFEPSEYCTRCNQDFDCCECACADCEEHVDDCVCDDN